MTNKKSTSAIDAISQKLIYNVGTNESLVIHTILFVGIFSLRFFNIKTEEILLILTTALSIEAVYLAIFIQITVNRTTESLAGVEEDIDDIQEDVDSLETNFKGISEDYLEDSSDEVDVVKVLKDMELRLKDLQKDIATLQKKSV